ncbi:hypothetical protein CTI12_AA565720 [Artemisia annua]|uniref:Uncharacterized protein n=1 Tax=Artemisia annua TaxID=35608 RepID=A0A2U1KTR5_ARTAN|nr:hypothetical protein CTI12_AA565720 [Artemisia annua]
MEWGSVGGFRKGGSSVTGVHGQGVQQPGSVTWFRDKDPNPYLLQLLPDFQACIFTVTLGSGTFGSWALHASAAQLRFLPPFAGLSYIRTLNNTPFPHVFYEFGA